MLILVRAIHYRRALLRMREEQGTTLIELLVALVAGLMVTGALLAILEVSLKQSANLVDKVQANQLGRTAMTKIVDELHSACIAPSFTPVQTGAGENELIFITAYSPEAVISSAEEHRIVYSSTSKTLTDKTYKSNGGTWPKFTFPGVASPTSTVLLVSNITHARPTGTTEEPIFKYFKYAEKSTESGEKPLTTLEEKGLGKTLSETEAAVAASVLIQFNAAAEDGNSTINRSVNLSGQVTFSFSVPNSETPVHDFPCQ